MTPNTTTHLPGPDGLLGSVALCGATSWDSHNSTLRMHSTQATCHICASLPAPDEAVVMPPSDPYPGDVR